MLPQELYQKPLVFLRSVGTSAEKDPQPPGSLMLTHIPVKQSLIVLCQPADLMAKFCVTTWEEKNIPRPPKPSAKGRTAGKSAKGTGRNVCLFSRVTSYVLVRELVRKANLCLLPLSVTVLGKKESITQLYQSQVHRAIKGLEGARSGRPEF